jgi:hypothetical protein
MKPLDHAVLAGAMPLPFAQGPLRVTVLSPAGLARAERLRWADLAARAAPGNIFAADWFMEPAIRHLAKEWTLRLAVVREASGAWLGMLPLALTLRDGHLPVPCWRNWQAAEGIAAAPLIRAGAERAFWTALLAHCDRHPGAALALACTAMPLGDPIQRALAELCEEQGRDLHICGRFSRPARLARNTVAEPCEGAPADPLDRLEQQLAVAHGPVRLVLHQSAEDCEPWLAAFLALARGHAGDRRIPSPDTRGGGGAADLLREVIRRGHRSGAVRLASLTAGETIAAMSCWFLAEGHGSAFRTVADRRLDAFEPARLLMRRIVGLPETAGLRLFETCTAPAAPEDPIWPDRRIYADIAVAIGGTARRALLARLLRGGECTSLTAAG